MKISDQREKLMMPRMLLILFPLILFIAMPSIADDEEKKKDDSLGTVIGIDLGTTYSW